MFDKNCPPGRCVSAVLFAGALNDIIALTEFDYCVNGTSSHVLSVFLCFCVYFVFFFAHAYFIITHWAAEWRKIAISKSLSLYPSE
jgi:hypothetical protein